MSFNPSPTKYQGVTALNPPDVIRAARAPTTADLNHPFNTLWVNTAGNDVYMYTNSAAGVATWTILGNIASAGTDGQLLIGDTGGDPVWAAPTSSDSSVTFTAGAGTLNIAASLKHADVTLTAAEVKALAATPQELVAAPAAGNTIMFVGAVLKLNYGGTNAFTEADDNLAIRYTDGSGAIVSETIEMTGFIDQTADTYTNAIPKADAIVAATGAEAQALVLDNLNDEIAGNAADDNTLTVRVYYTVQAI